MRRSARWFVPAGVIGMVAVAAVAPGASADLPAKSPEEVLVMAAESDVESFSGTVVARTDLGIPTALLMGDATMGGGPGGPGGMDSDRTVRVWKDGDDLARASMASLMGETTLIRDGDTVWVYDSSTGVVTTGTVEGYEGKAAGDDSDAPWASDVPDPAEAAAWLIDALEPTTTVAAGEPTVVAGREAYEVVLTPTQPGTLVGSASMAVDAQTGAVLRVQVTATGSSTPAVDIGYTAFDPSAPSADVFDTSTPPGATVEPLDLPDDATSYDREKPADVDEPTVVGEGWTSVLVLPEVPADLMGGDTAGADATEGMDAGGALALDVLTPVDGGAVLTTSLVSVLVTDDGRVLLGAVTPDVLTAAAR